MLPVVETAALPTLCGASWSCLGGPATVEGAGLQAGEVQQIQPSLHVTVKLQGGERLGSTGNHCM